IFRTSSSRVIPVQHRYTPVTKNILQPSVKHAWPIFHSCIASETILYRPYAVAALVQKRKKAEQPAATRKGGSLIAVPTASSSLHETAGVFTGCFLYIFIRACPCGPGPPCKSSLRCAPLRALRSAPHAPRIYLSTK